VPAPVRTDVRFTAVSAGSQRTCAIAQDGAAYCWGRFSLPSLDAAARSAARPVAVPGGFRLSTVGTGQSHACGIALDSKVYCWGSNRYGELGVGPAGAPAVTPVPPAFAAGRDSAFTLVSASATNSCAVGWNGDAYCWGRNLFGQLGNARASQGDERTATPTLVTGGHRWRLIRSAGGFTCGLTVAGQAYCWGISSRPLSLAHAPDRCDGPPPRECSTQPISVAGELRFRDLAVGGRHVCGVTTDGRMYCWGDNDHGQLGNGSRAPAEAPTAVVSRP
jgi:alpha-tubulin suppressor-like RCC1 family protein